MPCASLQQVLPARDTAGAPTGVYRSNILGKLRMDFPPQPISSGSASNRRFFRAPRVVLSVCVLSPRHGNSSNRPRDQIVTTIIGQDTRRNVVDDVTVESDAFSSALKLFPRASRWRFSGPTTNEVPANPEYYAGGSTAGRAEGGGGGGGGTAAQRSELSARQSRRGALSETEEVFTKEKRSANSQAKRNACTLYETQKGKWIGGIAENAAAVYKSAAVTHSPINFGGRSIDHNVLFCSLVFLPAAFDSIRGCGESIYLSRCHEPPVMDGGCSLTLTPKGEAVPRTYPESSVLFGSYRAGFDIITK
ncbi:hypothetical protein DBV15_03624 [Temnothorax longispinosus]|uniref:Uncharacterized protein n=1 Tax=Temnothorax longispinosus TaxID=300112 RepID=A0A4S2KL74_9HYME|nr:hypothetical protein DBV15_03624 [Temnothorax longispinosus]